MAFSNLSNSNSKRTINDSMRLKRQEIDFPSIQQRLRHGSSSITLGHFDYQPESNESLLLFEGQLKKVEENHPNQE